MPFEPTRKLLSFPPFIRVLLLMAPLWLGGCEATLFAGLNATDQHRDITQHADIVFDEAHGLALDVYAPAHASHAPVVVFFYGGTWVQGERAWYRFVGTALAAHGVVAVIPDYRKYPQVRLDGFMQDAASAVAWTHAHATELGGAPDDVFVMGHSAGGQIAALLATDPEWLGAHGMQPADLAGLIGLAGCYDFVPVPQDDAIMLGVFGATPAQQRRGQPVSYVHGAEPPMLLLQGTDDDEVEPSNAISLYRATQAEGEDSRLRTYPGVGHEALLFALSRPMDGAAPTLGDVMAFILSHPHAKPSTKAS
ncbi:alpha/beta hydrolase [Dyella telluris]|uniref:Alpha/beta hydrolase n=1 Tax=Dyella telluris TaxID=2763498 RepID=A0A7G8PZU6_9GAMM|nr:alpha/beta hydrolase [Dyella telluris]QNK00054.1 alpha/beta hydrolase [Dyella telluris]